MNEGNGAVAPERALLHPLWWAALGVMALNDHVLKGAGVLPGVVTGKLSDVAGLVVAPVLLASLVRARSPRAILACHVAVGLVFAALEVSTAFAAAWVAATAWLGVPWQVTCDPTDLLALPALLVSHRVLVPWMRRPAPLLGHLWRTTLQRAAMVLGSVACIATSPVRPARPAVVADRVLAQAWYATPLVVIETKTGNVQAKLDLETPMDPPIAADGTVWAVAWQDDAVVALELPSGKQKWRTPVKDAWLEGPKDLDARNVYVLERPRQGDSDGPTWTLVAFDRATGARGWSVKVGKFAGIAVVGGAVMTAFGKQLAALDATTGKTRWSLPARAEIAAIATDGERVYAGDLSGQLVAVTADAGKQLWTGDAKSPTAFGRAGYYYDEPRIGAAGGVVVFVADERLVAVDAKTGAPRWTRPATSHAVASNDIIVARSQDDFGAFFGLDPESGHERWRVKVHDTVLGTPVIGEGLVLLRPHSAHLLAFDAKHGHQRWTVDLDAGTSVLLSR